MARLLLTGTAIAVVMTLAGCGKPAALTTAPVAPEAAPVFVPLQSQAEGTGRVEIRVAGFGGYHVQATVAEVEYLRVELSGGPLAAPMTQEVTTADLEAGRGTVAFEAVPNGTVDVAVTALDGEGLTLGTTTTTATVKRGETAIVAATLKLEATHLTPDDGGLGLDLTLEDGDVVVDPIASAPEDADSPVLAPAPSPLPSITPEVAVYGELERTWFGDGTVGVAGTVKNGFATTRTAKVTVTFRAKTLFGTKVVETVTEDLGLVKSKAAVNFTVRSTEKVTTLWGDGEVEVAVESAAVE